MAALQRWLVGVEFNASLDTAGHFGGGLSSQSSRQPRCSQHSCITPTVKQRAHSTHTRILNWSHVCQLQRTVVSSSMWRVKLSSHGRFTQEMVSALTQHSDSIGWSGCGGTVPLVQYTTILLNTLYNHSPDSATRVSTQHVHE